MGEAKKANGSKRSLFTASVAELVAIGTAIGANCEPCFKYHYNEAKRLGVSIDDMIRAVELAERVKHAPAQNMRVLVDKILGSTLASKPIMDPNPGSCASKASVRKNAKSAKCGCK